MPVEKRPNEQIIAETDMFTLREILQLIDQAFREGYDQGYAAGAQEADPHPTTEFTKYYSELAHLDDDHQETAFIAGKELMPPIEVSPNIWIRPKKKRRFGRWNR